MKGVADRTKVVLRRLPPTITQAMLVDQIDDSFANRYKLISFRPGNNRLGFIFMYVCVCGWSN